MENMHTDVRALRAEAHTASKFKMWLKRHILVSIFTVYDLVATIFCLHCGKCLKNILRVTMKVREFSNFCLVFEKNYLDSSKFL